MLSLPRLMASVRASLPLAQTSGDVADRPGTTSLCQRSRVPLQSTDQNAGLRVLPHAARRNPCTPGAPLWNRDLSDQTYTTYTSSSLDAETIDGTTPAAGGQFETLLVVS